jgi:hypothetical protein
MGEPGSVLVDRRSGRSRGLAGLEYGLLLLSGRTLKIRCPCQEVLGARQGTKPTVALDHSGVLPLNK